VEDMAASTRVSFWLSDARLCEVDLVLAQRNVRRARAGEKPMDRAALIRELVDQYVDVALGGGGDEEDVKEQR
jgi:3-keto-L-gulonate-6-phosphate decarboxylase